MLSRRTGHLVLSAALVCVQLPPAWAGESPVVDTQQSSTGSAVSQEQLNQLPTSRSYADLLTLVPGITNHKSSATDSVNWSRMPFSEGVRQAAQAIDPSALNELNVLSSNYSAPYSRLSGAPDVQGFSRYYLEDLARSREWPGEAAGMNGMLMATGKARGKERVAVLYDDEGYPIEYFTADDLKRHPDEVLEELHEMCDLISDGKLTVETGMLSSNKITTSSGKLYLDGYGDFMYGPPGVSLPLNVRNALAQPAYDLPKDYKLDLSLKRYAFGGGMQQLDPPTTPFGQQSLQQDAKPQKKEGVVTAPEVAEGLRDLGRKAGAGDKDAAKIIEGLGPFLTDGAKQELSRGVGEGVTSTPTTSGSPGGQQPQQGGAASTPRQEDSMPPLSPLRFPKLPVGGGMTQLDPPSTPSGQQTLQQDAKPVTPSPQVRVDGGSSSVTMPVDTTPEQPATAASDQPTESVLDDLGPGPTPPLHPQPEGEPTVKTASDGTTVRTFPDGTTERISPNGHTFVRYADNSTFERYPDGTAVDRAPDGSTTTRDKDGKVTGRTGATVIDLDRKVDRAVDRHMRMQRMSGEPSGQEQPPQRDKKRTTSKKVSPKKREKTELQTPPRVQVALSPTSVRTTDVAGNSLMIEKQADGSVMRTRTDPAGTVVERNQMAPPDRSRAKAKDQRTFISIQNGDGTATRVEKQPDGTMTRTVMDASGRVMDGPSPTFGDTAFGSGSPNTKIPAGVTLVVPGTQPQYLDEFVPGAENEVIGERDEITGLTEEEARAGSAQALGDMLDRAKEPERDEFLGMTDEEARAASAQALGDMLDRAKGPESGPGGVSQPDASWGEGAWWPLADPGTEPADPSWWREGGWWPLAESGSEPADFSGTDWERAWWPLALEPGSQPSGGAGQAPPDAGLAATAKALEHIPSTPDGVMAPSAPPAPSAPVGAPPTPPFRVASASTTDANGNTVTIEKQPDGTTTRTVTDAGGRVVSVTKVELPPPTKPKQKPQGPRTSASTLNADGNTITIERQPNGTVTRTVTDPTRRVISTGKIEPPPPTKPGQKPQGPRTSASTTDANGNTITIERQPDGTTTRTVTDPKGRVIERGKVEPPPPTRAERKLGPRTSGSTRNPDGTTTIITRNADGSATRTITDRDGRVIRQEPITPEPPTKPKPRQPVRTSASTRDADGNTITIERQPDGSVTRTVTDPSGRVISQGPIEQPPPTKPKPRKRGETSASTRDEQGNTITVEKQPDGSRIRTVTDPSGRVIERSQTAPPTAPAAAQAALTHDLINSVNTLPLQPTPQETAALANAPKNAMLTGPMQKTAPPKSTPKGPSRQQVQNAKNTKQQRKDGKKDGVVTDQDVADAVGRLVGPAVMGGNEEAAKILSGIAPFLSEQGQQAVIDSALGRPPQGESIMDELGHAEQTLPLNPHQPKGDPTVTNLPNGDSIRQWPDGTREVTRTDGTQDIRYPDGSTFHRNADGTTVDTAADGSQTTRDKDGNVTGRRPAPQPPQQPQQQPAESGATIIRDPHSTGSQPAIPIDLDKILGPSRPGTPQTPSGGPSTGAGPISKLEDTHIFSSNFYLTGMASYIDGRFSLVSSGPQTDEVLFGVEHALLPEFVIGLNTTYQRLNDLIKDEELQFTPFFESGIRIGDTIHSNLGTYKVGEHPILDRQGQFTNGAGASPAPSSTQSFYVNDRWQINDRWSANLGVRYDKPDPQPTGAQPSGSLSRQDYFGGLDPGLAAGGLPTNLVTPRPQPVITLPRGWTPQMVGVLPYGCGHADKIAVLDDIRSAINGTLPAPGRAYLWEPIHFLTVKRKEPARADAAVTPNDPLYEKPGEVTARAAKRAAFDVGQAMSLPASAPREGAIGTAKPKGPKANDQWGLQAVGFTPLSQPGSAWSLVDSDAPNTIVAVIDSGLDLAHPDGPQYLWTNPGEVAGNGKDDDGNGLVDDVHGWNFKEENSDLTDLKGHGTLVAGIIAAKRNNGLGIAGINPGARIMVLKITDQYGQANSLNFYRAMHYAVAHGARVINVSLGDTGLSKLEQLAINHAHSHGAIVVVAAGNEADEVAKYGPAGLRRAIAVAGLGMDKQPHKLSNFGAAIALAAPGEEIYSLQSKDAEWVGSPSERERRFRPATGTSFAAPIVAATASLILAKNPRLPNVIVEDMLLGAMEHDWNPATGWGMLNAAAALSFDPRQAITIWPNEVVVNRRKKEVASVDVFGTIRGVFSTYRVELGQGFQPASWQPIGGPISRPVTQGLLCRIPGEALKGGGEWTIRMTAEADGVRRVVQISVTL